jgi:hypothetical protein
MSKIVVFNLGKSLSWQGMIVLEFEESLYEAFGALYLFHFSNLKIVENYLNNLCQGHWVQISKYIKNKSLYTTRIWLLDS